MEKRNVEKEDIKDQGEDGYGIEINLIKKALITESERLGIRET